jgi:hypothetical protein
LDGLNSIFKYLREVACNGAPGDEAVRRWCPEQAIGGAGDGPGMGELHEGAQIFEQGRLLKRSPDE